MKVPCRICYGSRSVGDTPEKQLCVFQFSAHEALHVVVKVGMINMTRIIIIIIMHFNCTLVLMVYIKVFINNLIKKIFDTHPHQEPHSSHFVKEKATHLVVFFMQTINEMFFHYFKMQF